MSIDSWSLSCVLWKTVQNVIKTSQLHSCAYACIAQVQELILSIHIYVHTDLHVQREGKRGFIATHTTTHTHTQSCIHTHTHAHTHNHTHICSHTQSHTYAHTHNHTHICSHTQSHTHMLTHTITHTYAHTHAVSCGVSAIGFIS